MHTQILTVNTQDRSHEIERSEEAAIAGEIARRFIEMREATSGVRAIRMINRLHTLSQIHTEAVWIVLHLLTGDMSEITKSYAEMGREHGKTKQGVEQDRSRALEAIERHWPELAQVVIELRHITSENRANK